MLRANLHNERIEIRGTCISACTMWLVAKNLCVAPDAMFWFHAARDPIIGWTDPGGSALMMSMYPLAVSRWAQKEGALRKTAPIWYRVTTTVTMRSPMRTTIAGIRYDTARADALAGVSYGEHPDDPERWAATFDRRTTTGEIFLAGSGGAMTRFKGKARILLLSSAERDQLIDWYGVKP